MCELLDKILIPSLKSATVISCKRGLFRSVAPIYPCFGHFPSRSTPERAHIENYIDNLEFS